VSGPAAPHADLVVVDPGPLCTVQDLGRPGFGRLAVGRSGAFDRAALRLGNRLLGNDEGAAGLEAVLVGPTVRATRGLFACITGAAGPLWLDDRPVDRGAPVWLAAGATLRVGPATRGLRSYLAVRGGLDVPPTLGSASSDTLSGLGPPALRAGDRLDVAGAAVASVRVDHVPVPGPPDPVVLHVILGPDDDLVAAAGLDVLLGTTFTVAPASNRVGLRLSGCAVPRPAADGLPSAPLVRGAVQLPPDGQPVIMGPDHPVTGGYPVPVVVADADTDVCGQLRPGAHVRFRA
jgi:biotin-dependent carboxylase-like uncharacterized protein